MRRAGLLLFGLMLLAPAAASACDRRSSGPRHVAAVPANGTAVVLCDRRTGRGRVVARGAFFTQASARRGRAAWIEQRTIGDSVVATLVLLDLTTGERIRDEVGRSAQRVLDVGVVVVSHRVIAFTIWDDPAAPGGARRLVLRRNGAPDRILARGDLGELELEDGVTIRADAARSPGVRFFDLASPPVRGGCPDRERFELAARLGAVAVTRAEYRGHNDLTQVVRACVVGSGRDVVIATATSAFGLGALLRPVAGAHGVVVVARLVTDAYRNGCHTSVEGYEVATGRLLRSERVEGCDVDAPQDVVRRVRDG